MNIDPDDFLLDDPPRGSGPDSLSRLKGPAIGLLVVAGLDVLMKIASLVRLALVGTDTTGMPPELAEVMQQWGPLINLLSMVVGVALTVIVILGAVKMLQGRNLGLAMAGSICACIPCFGPCCLLAVPFGIWALVVLRDPQVKQAFD